MHSVFIPPNDPKRKRVEGHTPHCIIPIPNVPALLSGVDKVGADLASGTCSITYRQRGSVRGGGSRLQEPFHHREETGQFAAPGAIQKDLRETSLTNGVGRISDEGQKTLSCSWPPLAISDPL